MNRREFLIALSVVRAHSQLSAQGPPGLLGAATVREDWLARHKEPILEPDLRIIDPHHHLWIRPGSRYLADDLLADMNSGHNIIATVHVQAQSMYRQSGPSEMRPIGETEFVNGVAAMFASGAMGQSRACAGIVGRADLTLVMSRIPRSGCDGSPSPRCAQLVHSMMQPTVDTAAWTSGSFQPFLDRGDGVLFRFRFGFRGSRGSIRHPF